MNKKFTVAFIGCGNFAKFFVPLMKHHPYVEKVYVCDLIPERVQAYSEQFDVEIIDTYEQVLKDKSIDAIANFTQRHLHGDIVIRALKAGKHVYSAVPMAPTVKECQEIVKLVKETGLTYVIGETCYYYPCAMFCREAYRAGKFGEFSFASSQYYHHIDDINYGKEKDERGMPPLLYPTHSTAMVLTAVDSYVKRVVCFGCKDRANDPAFVKENNVWGNEDINQYVLMELANGGTARITEARGFGYGRPSSYISGFYGTEGSYEFSNAQHIRHEKLFGLGKETIKLENVSDYLNPTEMTKHKGDHDFMERVANGEWQWDVNSPIQELDMNRLPKEYEGLPNGHMGSHKFLIDDFCKAVYNNEMPILNAWMAARCTIPGLVAIESAKQGGVTLDVPDCGDAPEKL